LKLFSRENENCYALKVAVCGLAAETHFFGKINNYREKYRNNS